jgi:hypothetical protein
MRRRRHSFGHDAAAPALGAAKSFDKAGDRGVWLQPEALECRSIESAAMPAAHATHGNGRAHSGRHFESRRLCHNMMISLSRYPAFRRVAVRAWGFAASLPFLPEIESSISR